MRKTLRRSEGARDRPWWLTVKNLPAMQETWVRSLGREDPLEKEMATCSSTLAWEIPWTREPGRLQSMESHATTPWYFEMCGQSIMNKYMQNIIYKIVYNLLQF